MLNRATLTTAFFVLLIVPVSAWAFVKPVRLMAPEINGLICEKAVCVDDPARMEEATILYVSALQYVNSTVTPLRGHPLMVFCSTAACYRSFGGGAERAITYPNLGSLIAPTSWAPHFARHEMIHALQFQELGELQVMRAPAWFREGMAYSLSEPPPSDMPSQFLGYRDEFERWLRSIEGKNLWPEARKL